MARQAGSVVAAQIDNAWGTSLTAEKLVEFYRLMYLSRRTDDREIVLKFPQGEMRFPGGFYLTGFAIPNFYFHVTTAYALLRHKGVVLGKMDFLGGPPR